MSTVMVCPSLFVHFIIYSYFIIYQFSNWDLKGSTWHKTMSSNSTRVLISNTMGLGLQNLEHCKVLSWLPFITFYKTLWLRYNIGITTIFLVYNYIPLNMSWICKHKLSNWKPNPLRVQAVVYGDVKAWTFSRKLYFLVHVIKNTLCFDF